MGRCILGKISGAGSYRLCAGELRESDWLKISDAMKRLSEMNLFMVGPIRHAVMEEICAQARQPERERGRLKLLAVDNVALAGNADVGRTMKLLAQELQCPVVMTAKTNNEDRMGGGRPGLCNVLPKYADYADVVMLIHREEIYDPGTPDKGAVEVLLGRNSNGRLGTIRLRFDSRIWRFSDFQCFS